MKVYHTEDTRDAADSTKTHNNTDADLRPAVDIAVDKNDNWNEDECPVRNDIDDAVDVASGEDEASRKTFLRASKAIRKLGRISAHEERSEGIKNAVGRTDDKDGVEDKLLPSFGKNTKKEQTQRNLK